jgi:hypothetical protein
VVIAIIALLVTYCFRASTGQRPGNQLSAGSNQHSIGIALLMYANDYDGRLPCRLSKPGNIRHGCARDYGQGHGDSKNFSTLVSSTSVKYYLSQAFRLDEYVVEPLHHANRTAGGMANRRNQRQLLPESDAWKLQTRDVLAGCGFIL